MEHKLKRCLKKNKMNKSILILFLCMVLFSLNTFGQIKTVTGVVVDELNSPLPGVAVSETGTLNGVTTNFDGKYTIQISEGSSITFGYLGYKNIVRVVGKENKINISLIPDIESLNEIVVIGYGSVLKKDLTGSVATIKMEEINDAPVVSFDRALAGRVAGVQVGSSSGEPGSTANITIRGANSVNGDNSPLYVMDGFIVENFSPNIIDQSDIESINILKDASATAIYGVRGANGVIIITTKRGKSGKTKITYETRLDAKMVAKKLEVLNAYDFLELSLEINELQTVSRYFSTFDENTNQSIPIEGASIEDYRNTPSRDWQDEAFRLAITKSHKINIASGGEKTRFYASLNYLEDQGSLLNSNFKRLNGRLNLNHKINDKLSAKVDVMFTSYEQNGLDTKGDSSYSFLRNLITYNPVLNIYEDYEGRNPLDEVSDQFDLINIVSWHPIVSLENEYRRTVNQQFIANLGLKYNPTSNITLESKVSFNNQFRETGTYYNSNTVYGRTINKIDGINGSLDNRTWDYLNVINTANYKKSFKGHSIDFLLGTTYNSRFRDRQYNRYIDIPEYLEVLVINGLDGGTPDESNDIIEDEETRIFSLLTRLNYNYKSKYYFTASLRRDASSNFTRANRVGYFPSAAVSWNAHKEDFLKDLDIFSQLKFKFGYGRTGNDRIPSIAVFDVLTDLNASYFFNGQTVQGQRTTEFGSNPNLFWETTDQFNFGADIGLFDGRISLTAELYQKNTRDLLLNADTALSQGISTIQLNTGNVKNQGLELSLSTRNISNKDFSWTSDFNITFNKNTVVSLPESKPIFGQPNYYRLLSTNQFIVEEGKPLGNMYGYISDGVYQIDDFENYNSNSSTHTLAQGQPSYKNHQPGDEKYKDLNGDGEITAADKTIIGNAQPIHFGGFNNTFRYKNFELSAFLQWSYGNDVLNANRLIFENMAIANKNQLATTLDRWTLENQDTDMHRAGGQGFEDISSRVIEDASYLRLKTINFSYNFSQDILEKYKLSTLKIYFAAQNLLTLTDYSGFDPDVSVNNSPVMPGIDYSSYPIHKIFSFGLNASF